MSLLDNKGRVFGKINVIDLAVLAIIALLVLAAIGFVARGGGPQEVHLQADLVEVPAGAANKLQAGQRVDHGGAEITDVLVAARTNESARVFLKLRLTAEDSGSALRYRDTFLRPGEALTIQADGSTLSGSVALVDDSPKLTYLAGPEPMILAAPKTSAAIAQGIRVGHVGEGPGNDLFLATTIRVLAGNAGGASVFLTGDHVRLSPVPQEKAPLVAGARQEFVFPSGVMNVLAYSFPDASNLSLPLEPAKVRVLVPVSPGELVPELGPVGGVTGGTLGNITSVILLEGPTVNGAGSGPAPPAIEVQGQRPNDAGVTVAGTGTGVRGPALYSVELLAMAIRTSDGFDFGGDQLMPGEAIMIASGAGIIAGKILQVGTAIPSSPRNVTLLASNVPPWVAAALGPGASEPTIGEASSFTIGAVSVAPGVQVVSTSDGRLAQAQHPVNLDLTLDSKLLTGGTDAWPSFRGAPLVPGARFVVQPAGIPLEVQVLSVGSP